MTIEPDGKKALPASSALRFVIQRHAKRNGSVSESWF